MQRNLTPHRIRTLFDRLASASSLHVGAAAAGVAELLESRVLLASNLPAGFQESVYVAGFDTPTAQAFAPDGRLFVLEKAGKVRVVTASGALNSTPFVSLSVDTAQDRGLVALAFDPNFQSNRFLYLWYTKSDAAGTRNRLSRITASSTNANVAQAGSELVLLEVPHATNIHTGGAMSFGADGMLYLGVGDGGESNNAQNLGDLRGKVLRLNVANPANLIPADNPFVNTPGARPEIFARGLRNPFTGQMKPGTNTFYVNDVGETQYEEVDVIARGGRNRSGSFITMLTALAGEDPSPRSTPSSATRRSTSSARSSSPSRPDESPAVPRALPADPALREVRAERT